MAECEIGFLFFFFFFFSHSKNVSDAQIPCCQGDALSSLGS